MTKPAADPLTVDFRALTLLVEVHRTRSFTRTAETFGLNQSGVSYAIDKLRRVFDDTLFVREGAAIVPTERCEEVVTFAKGLLEGLDSLQDGAGFVPATSTLTFTIACNFYERVLLIPQIVRAIRSQAPLMEVEIIDAAGTGADKLLKSEADLLLGPFKRNDASFYTRVLYEDRYVCLLDPAHPAADRELSVEDYLALDHIHITYGGRWKSNYLLEIEAQNRTLDVALRVPSPAGIEHLVRRSGLVATIPMSLARQIGEGLAIRPCPFSAPLPIQMIWTARKHQSAAHKWLRDLVAGACRSSIAEISEGN